MTRRLALLPIAIVAILSLVLAACSSTPPAAPALTDPKEIVTKGVTSLQDVKTFEVTAGFTGSLTLPQMGNFDLSTIKMSAALDIPNKNAKISIDAPTLLGSKLDAILTGDNAYYKAAGAFASAFHGTADKYTKVPVPMSSGSPAANATDMTKLVAQLNAALAQLPSPLVKGADEKCGDLDCYHVSTVVTAAQAKALDPTVSLDGDITVNLWTRKSDYRPAKIGISVASPSYGTIGFTIEIKYDVAVSVAAPPADQIAP